MIFIILLIYFIILIIIEFLHIIFSNKEDKELLKLHPIDKEDDIYKYNLLYNSSEEDVNINNYIGKFYLKNEYGFYINLNNWNLLETGILYNFLVPVNIKIIKIDTNIEYYIDDNTEIIKKIKCY